MKVDGDQFLAAQRLIHLEAHCLDRRRWDEWLALYRDDAVLWAPAWKSEEETVSDPEVHLNLLYLKGKAALGDRIFRIRTRDSLATMPMDRTTHVVGTVLLHAIAAERIELSASWVVHSNGHGGIFTRGGFYDYTLVQEQDTGELTIALKKITLLDDRLEGPIDVYHL